MNEETIFPRCTYDAAGYGQSTPVHIQIQNERYIVSIHPLEIGDFDIRIKQKTLSTVINVGIHLCRTLQR